MRILIIMFVLLSLMLLQEPSLSAMEDTAAIRYAHRDILEAPLSLLSVGSQIWEQAGKRALFRVEESTEYWYLLVIPEVGGNFPIASAGSYVIRRSKQDGSFSQLKIFLASHQRLVARITPRKNESVMTISLDDNSLYQGIPLRIPFGQLIVSPFDAVIERTRGMIDWDMVLPDVPDYQSIITMVNTIREELPFLPDAEDGAMDAEGNLVFIESLRMQGQLPGFNCSGFVKWVGDGLYYPLHQKYLAIDDLKARQTSLRGSAYAQPFEEQRDPYFGLDWSRNLAQALAGTDSSFSEHFDVRNVSIAHYHEDIGYAMDDLSRVLYWLAIHEPGHFYIASFNKEFGTSPVLRQHVHLAALFPYFDEAGEFRTVVMERNVESSVVSLQRRYVGDFVHLVRAQASSNFSPPRIHDSR